MSLDYVIVLRTVSTFIHPEQKHRSGDLIFRLSFGFCFFVQKTKTTTIEKSKHHNHRITQPPTTPIESITMAASALLSSLTHPSELASLISFQFLGGKNKIFPPNDLSQLPKTMVRCYELLNKTSRSFAAVIQALDPELRPAICIFYLVLRALDTIEDDMSIDLSEKIKELNSFHDKLNQQGWTYHGNSDKEKDKILMIEFNVVIAEFMKLKPQYQSVIADICLQMGKGMAEFAEKQDVETKEDYYLYCHYVAGLVGIGLSQLFSESKLENAALGENTHRANSMGLFLQKTNIIRDYLEDLVDGRTWYPKEIWSKYADNLAELQQPENRSQALSCLNHMVTDALQHIPDVFDYMDELRNPTVFNFCAIPQVMAIATLALCYDNGKIFEGVVKIRKGTAVSLMMKATSMNNVYEIFDQYLMQLKTKLRRDDPSYETTLTAINKAEDLLAGFAQKGTYTAHAQPLSGNTTMRVAMAVAAGAIIYTLTTSH